MPELHKPTGPLAAAGSDMVLMTVALDEPSLAAAAKSLGVAAGALDADFGVLPVDPDHGLYAIKVRRNAVPAAAPGKPYRGPFSDPKISGYGPPKSRAR